MKKPVFTGSAVALITPFRDNKVDFDALGKLIDFQIEGGTAAIVVCGTTGEAPTLADDEHHAVIDFAVAHTKKRVPVIAGSGSNDTQHAVDMSNYALHAGADAVLMVSPYYNKPTQKGLLLQYTYIAERVDLPIILYNIPGRTGVSISASVFEKLAKFPNINGVKEASGNFALVNDIRHRCGDEMNMWAGNDDITVPIMSLGGCGVVSTAANIIPRVMSDICAKWFAGDREGAANLQLEYYDILRDLFIETNPIPIKAAANLMGLPAGHLRLPMCEPEDATMAQLKKSLANHGLIKI
jgi:4-hydroxy-tetrahydrodipicolinate synthase